MAFMYKQPPQYTTLPVNILKKLQDLPNYNAENKNDPTLLKILPSLKNLLKVFSGRQAHIFL